MREVSACPAPRRGAWLASSLRKPRRQRPGDRTRGQASAGLPGRVGDSGISRQGGRAAEVRCELDCNILSLFVPEFMGRGFWLPRSPGLNLNIFAARMLPQWCL